MKIIDVKWFSGNFPGCIGIVLTIGKINDHKAYIGLGEGIDKELDANKIANHGAPFYQGPALWPNIQSWRT